MARFDRLGAVIGLLREKAGLKQRELARRADITQAMLSHYERGTRKPSLPTLGKILDVLDLYLGTLDDGLDLVNERPSRRRRTGDPRGEPIEGVDLPSFLGIDDEPLPPRVERAFVEMIRGFRQVARVQFHTWSAGLLEPRASKADGESPAPRQPRRAARRRASDPEGDPPAED